MKLSYDHRYDDIINMPHHKSKNHPQMSLYARSSQFASFAALTGYEDEVKKTAIAVEKRIEKNEKKLEILNGKMI